MRPIRINNGVTPGTAINSGSGNNITVDKPAVVQLSILAGQSNVGRARTSLMTAPQQALYAGVRPNTRIFNPYISTSALNNMNVGVNTMLFDAGTTDEFGCEASLFERLDTTNVEERVLLKYGDGATSMRLFWGSRTPKEGWLNLLAYTETVVDLILAEGKTVVLKNFIWMQGEGDAGSESFANQYLGGLTDFNTDFRDFWQDLIVEKGLTAHDYMFVVGRINSPTNAYRDIVRAAQATFVSNNPSNSILIDTDSYPMFDIVHYDETGQIQFGLDIYNAIT